MKTLAARAAFTLLLLGAAAPEASGAPEERTADGDSTYLLYRPAARPEARRARSVPLAFGLSAAVPGAGQAYNRHWIKAAALLAVEAALWTGYAVWRRDGRAGERAFQEYAHAHWSAAAYATWLNRYLEETAGLETPPIDVGLVAGVDFTRPEAWTPEQQAAVRRLFQAVQAAESGARHANGAVFSHKLPFFGEQQYYELIGKYFQFAPGWDDYGGALDPEVEDATGRKVNVSPRFYDYAARHGRANDLLRRASRATSFLLLNHVASAVEAAVQAKLHNDRLGVGVSLAPAGPSGAVTMAELRFRF